MGRKRGEMTATPVSYTHLDVYKRQRLNRAPETINKNQLLFGINQGGTYEDLRVWHMREIAKQMCIRDSSTGDVGGLSPRSRCSTASSLSGTTPVRAE